MGGVVCRVLELVVVRGLAGGLLQRVVVQQLLEARARGLGEGEEQALPWAAQRATAHHHGRTVHKAPGGNPASGRAP